VVRGIVSAGGDAASPRVVSRQVIKNPVTRGWRLVFQVQPDGGDPLELRAYLERAGNALTETWSYLLRP
jgi:glucans biosynthesis protein